MAHKKRNKRFSNPDFRRRINVPAPSVKEIEQKVLEVLPKLSFPALRELKHDPKLRDRKLTLPVLSAIVVSLVWRQIPSLMEVLRVLAREGLLWVKSKLKVSKQALSERLRNIPAKFFADLFQQVIARMRESRKSKSSLLPGQEAWASVQQYFSVIWIADGSTLEALRGKIEALKNIGHALGGKMMMIVEAFTHQAVTTFYTQDANANDKRFTEQLLQNLPERGLLIVDLGFFSFAFFSAFYEQVKFFITRLREKTSYRTIYVLSQGPRYRDEVIEMGSGDKRCRHQFRLVSVLWNQTWYRYLTNVLDPEVLSARQVCELYRRRWRIEDAFSLTKRLLGLSYLWVGDSNGVEIQIYVTWIFYAVLNDVCQNVALALGEPLERISVEMVFRSFYHFWQAQQNGAATNLVAFLAEHSALLGILKPVRKRHRLAEQQNLFIWNTDKPSILQRQRVG